MDSVSSGRLVKSKSAVGEIYTTVGWIIIVLGIVLAVVIFSSSRAPDVFLVAVGTVIAGAVMGVPMLAIGSALTRLAQLVQLQEDQNEMARRLLKQSLEQTASMQHNNELFKTALSRRRNPE